MGRGPSLTLGWPSDWKNRDLFCEGCGDSFRRRDKVFKIGSIRPGALFRVTIPGEDKDVPAAAGVRGMNRSGEPCKTGPGCALADDAGRRRREPKGTPHMDQAGTAPTGQGAKEWQRGATRESQTRSRSGFVHDLPAWNLPRFPPQRQVGLQFGHQAREIRQRERLRAVAEGLLRARMDFQNQAVGADRGRSAGKGGHQATFARCVAGSSSTGR